MIREGTVTALLSEEKARFRLLALPVERAEGILSGRWTIARETDSVSKETWLLVDASADEAAEVIRLLVQGGVAVQEAVRRRQTLEQYFLRATGEGDSHA
jgi:hypothetical protein